MSTITNLCRSNGSTSSPRAVSLPARPELVEGFEWENEVIQNGSFVYKIPADTTATFIKIHEGENSLEASWHFELEAGSSVILCPIIVGNGNISLSIKAQLHENAQLVVAGAYALSGTQTCSITTRQEHHGASSTSNLVINGIVADAAYLQYQGAIDIQKDAALSVARQENKSLLMSNQAKALSIPSLEVQNNDVQCAHGSAVGPLAEDQLIYAQSRGLSLMHARKLLITSFFAQALSGMLDENLREKMVEKLVSKIMVEKNNRPVPVDEG